MMADWPFEDLTPMKYGAILADPPWAYAMRSEKGHAKSPEAHYSTMSLAGIKALPVAQLAGPDCYLFLWSTWPHLPQAFATAVVAATATQTNVTADATSALPQADWIIWIVLALAIVWLLWRAFTYRDVLAAKVQTQLPKLASFLRSF